MPNKTSPIHTNHHSEMASPGLRQHLLQGAFTVLNVEVNDDGVYRLTIRFPLQGGGTSQLKIDRSLLRDRRQLQKVFADKGAALPRDISGLLEAWEAHSLVGATKITRRSGWHGNVFVSRHGSFSERSTQPNVLFDPSDPFWKERRSAGTMKQYVEGIAPFLDASDYLILSTVLALTAPLAALIGRREGVSICLFQESSTGKSLALRVAHSLTDHAEEADLFSFGHTTGRILEALPSFAGTCVSFGDIKAELNDKAAMEKLRALVFNSKTGSGREMKGQARSESFQFSIPFISAERPLAELFKSQRLQFEDGENVRVLSIPVPPRREGGIFADHASDRTADLANELDRFLGAHHGTVMPWWIAQLIHVGAEKLSKVVKAKQDSFRRSLGNLPGHHDRIAKQFALFSAVGFIARQAKIVALDHARIEQAMKTLFGRCILHLQQRSTPEIDYWQNFFDLVENRTLVPVLEIGEAPSNSSIVGFCRITNGVGEINVLRKPLVREFGASFVDDVLLPRLENFGCIRRNGDDELSIPIQQAGLGRKRYYKIAVVPLQRLKATAQ